MTVQWGTPIIGARTEVSGDREFKVGDLAIAKGDMLFSPDLQTEQMVVDVVKAKYAHFTPNFELKYVKARSYKKEIWGRIQEWHCEIEVHVVCVEASPLNWYYLGSLIGTLLVIIGLAVAAWIFYYVGEELGPIGIAGIIAIAILILVIVVAGFRFRGKG